MNVWRLMAANNLVPTAEDLPPEEGKRRVRVTKVFVNSVDALIYRGLKKVKYPIVPGRYAVGLIADDKGGTGLHKGARVLLHSYLPAQDTGTDAKTFTEKDYRILGRTEDGFLRDFVYAREDEMTPIPDAVNDEKSLLIQYVALAHATVEKLDVHQGEHIAVIGANLLGLFISRLLIYRQAAPILVDTRKDRLLFARSRGVYYTSLADDNLMSMVGSVTGGRLADGVICVMSAGEMDRELPIRVCATGKNIAFCGDGDSFTLDLNGVVHKQLTVHGVMDGNDYLETALNLVANKAVDLSAFRYLVLPAEKTGLLFRELAQNPERPVEEINIVNLV